MAKPGTDRAPQDGHVADPQDQPCETRVLALLDEIYDLEQFRREQLTLRKLGSYLKAALTTDEVCSAIECFGPKLWPSATGALYLLHGTEDALERAAAWGDDSLNKHSFSMGDCWGIRRSHPHYVPDTASELICGHIVQGSEALPSLCAPVVAQGRPLGLLHLQGLSNVSSTSQSGVSADTNMVLAMVAVEDLGLSLANMRLRETLREQSIRDSLTGLFNRRFVDEYLVRELSRAQRKARQISLIALDIDHFKRINDTYGHSAGDAVLQQVGIVLKEHIRDSDVASRVGGEEFLLLLAESPLELAAKRAEDVRSAIHELSVKFEDKDLGRITASFGAAAFPDHGHTPEALFRAADEALYRAKSAGRNRVVSARVPPV
jgi:diguanylate cyclase (GGDEF)-like protein